MKTTSDTPRTDAATFYVRVENAPVSIPVVGADMACELERALAVAAKLILAHEPDRSREPEKLLDSRCAKLETALRDVLSCFEGDHACITAERIEAWKAAL